MKWPSRVAPNWQARRAAQVLLPLAAFGAGYLAFVSLSGGAVAGCGPNSGCAHVMANRWAYWLGIPVSLPALLAYLTLLGATWFAEQSTASSPRRANLSRFLVISLSLLIIAAAIWFVSLQYFIIGSWCKFCLATHSAAVSAASLLLWGIPAAETKNEAAFPNSAPRNAGVWRWGLSVALAAFAVLVFGQFAVKKRLFAFSQALTADPPTAALEISLDHGRVVLDPGQLPMIGTNLGSNFIINLFDYTCRHCRDLHPLLRSAQAHYGDSLCIISLPAPMDCACNPLLRSTNPANSNACEYARLGLAVWRANRLSFPVFDDWMFDRLSTPPLDEARSEAERLVGKAQLEAALRDPWVSRQLKADINLYIADSVAAHDATLPQLVFADGVIRGSIDDFGDLTRQIDARKPLRRGAASPASPP